MDEYPWIKNIVFNPNEINNHIHIYLSIDPTIMEKQYGWNMRYYIKDDWNEGTTYTAESPYLFFDIPYEEATTISRKIEHIIYQLNRSSAIPQELKLPKKIKHSLIIHPTNQYI